MRTITAHTDTTNAVERSTDSVIIMPIITEIVLCLLLLAQGAVLSGEPLRLQIHILTLELETHSLSLIPRGVTYTEMTEGDTSTEPTIIVVAAHLIPHNRGTLHPKETQDKLQKLIPRKEHHCPQEEERDLIPGADLQVLILSAAQAAQAVAGAIVNITQLRACITLATQVYTSVTEFLIYCFPGNSDSNSSSSDGSRARSVQSSAAHAPTQSSLALDTDEPRRSFGIKVQNLPVRSTGKLEVLKVYI